MKYDYQYAIAAIVATITLLFIVYHRRSYPTLSNRIFILILVLNLVSASADMVTFWTISYPQNYSLPILYLTNMVYLITYSAFGASFLVYVGSLAKTESAKSISMAIAAFGWGIITILVLSTPFTHWMIYFDDSLQYRHGPLLWLMYIIVAILVLMSATIMFNRRNRFTSQQKAMVTSLVAGVTICVIVHILNSRLDIVNFVGAIILNFLYITFENPGDYTFRDTQCFNYRAFQLETIARMRHDKDNKVVFIGLRNSFNTNEYQNVHEFGLVSRTAAMMLHREFGKNVFAIDDTKFTIFLNESRRITEEGTLKRIKKTFDKKIKIEEKETNIIYKAKAISLEEIAKSEEDIIILIDGVRNVSTDELFSAESMNQLLRKNERLHDIAKCLDDAEEKGKLMAVYQPIYNIEKRTFESAEVLLRLSDPVLGNISPEEFIEVAEHTGHIEQLGNFALKSACEFLIKCRKQKLGIEFAEVNVSIAQMRKPDFACKALGIINEYGIEPGSINFEITESVPLSNDEVALANFNRLIEAGAQFAIDDYGSGYFFADYLFNFPVSIVKIDKAILWKAVEDEKARIVLNSTIEMVKKLGKTVVVEGAETPEMVKLVKTNGGEYIQGYFYSKPLGEDEFINFIERKNKKMPH